VRSALEWARVRALAADGLSQREIARRLGINRRTVTRMLASGEPPSYRRAPGGSQLDRFEPVLRRLLEEWPQIKAPRATGVLREYGYAGSVDVVRRRLRELRPATVRPAQRTGYRPGQVLQLDWAEMPTRPSVAGKERRVYALLASLPYSGAQTAFFSFDMTIESFLEGHVRAFEHFGGVPRECVYDNLRSVVARREGAEVVWNRRFLHLRGHYGFHATACTPATPREKGAVEAAVRYLKSGFWPARRLAGSRSSTASTTAGASASATAGSTRQAASRSRIGSTRSGTRCGRWRRHASTGRARARYASRSTATCVTAAASTGRRSGSCTSGSSCASTADQVWICHRGSEVARYERRYEQGVWSPPPIIRPEPPIALPPPRLSALAVAAPELADYAELCA
jgi:transposase